MTITRAVSKYIKENFPTCYNKGYRPYLYNPVTMHSVLTMTIQMPGRLEGRYLTFHRIQEQPLNRKPYVIWEFSSEEQIESAKKLIELLKHPIEKPCQSI